jgi:leucyl aminopeptidase
VLQLLPPERVATVRARRIALSDTEVARADAVILVVNETRWARALRELPFARVWTRLDRRTEATPEEPWLVSRLPTSRQTLAVVGRSRAGLPAFERLTLAAKLVRQALQPGVTSLRVFVHGFAAAESADLHEAIASAALAATAPMPMLKSTPPPGSKLARIELAIESLPGLERCLAISDGNHLARWLTALPPNVLDAVSYRGALAELARREGWRFRFYDEKTLRGLGAGAFLAVSRANAERGAGIVRLSFRPPARTRAPRIALVGKGICFDTGGINLKPHRSMYLMHGDMQGSAVATGTLLALSRQRAPLAIDCWLALTENEIGPTAYRPQEVVTALNGVTIQVVHSDAEGRMALADTLALACREGPRVVLDFATLTGACVNALTERYSGVFTNRDDWHAALREAGRSSGERVWPFPMDADFDAEIESKIADVLQCTLENKGDHILAARFLCRFVPAATPRVHNDLSASERKGGLAHVPTEFTGFGVRYATHLLGDASFLARLAE